MILSREALNTAKNYQFTNRPGIKFSGHPTDIRTNVIIGRRIDEGKIP